MKHQALFSSKDKSKTVKVLSAAILQGALRVHSERRLIMKILQVSLVQNFHVVS